MCVNHMLLFILFEYVHHSCAVMINIDLVGICFDAVRGYYFTTLNETQLVHQGRGGGHPSSLEVSLLS